MRELERWEEAEQRPVERHQNILKSRPLGISDEQWEQHLAQVKAITAGIRRVLPNGISLEELHDVIIEAQVWLLEHPEEKHPYNAGRRMATDWYREHYEVHTKKGVETIIKKETTIGDIEYASGEPFADWYHTNEPQKIEESHCSGTQLLSLPVCRELQVCRKEEPEAYAVVEAYLNQKGTKDNRFTSAERAAYKHAIQRLRKVVKK